MRDYTARFVASISGLFLLIAALWGGADQDDADNPESSANV